MSVSATVNDIWTQYVTTHSPELRDKLINEYAPLVRFVVGRMGIPSTSILDAEDLVSYGIIGLINAIDRFDPARGIRFEAFATSRIRGAVIDQLRALNWLPRSAVARVRQVEYAIANLEQRLGRPACDDEIAAEMKVPPERYRQILQEAGTVVLSLDAPLNSLAQDEGLTFLSDLIEDRATPGPDEQAEHRELISMLSTALDILPERERLLLALYYQEGLTMKEISRVMSVSESRVCQLHAQAILRLRSSMNANQAQQARTKQTREQRVAASQTKLSQTQMRSS